MGFRKKPPFRALTRRGAITPEDIARAKKAVRIALAVHELERKRVLAQVREIERRRIENEKSPLPNGYDAKGKPVKPIEKGRKIDEKI